MSSAQDKTKSIIRKNIAVENLVKNELNPNKMKAKEFNLLVDNIMQTGLTDPILVRPIDGEVDKYRIVGGHHRFDAATYLEFTEVPCTIITDPDFDDDAETFQVVRMNMIRGRMDPEGFMKMYNKVQGKYGDDILQDAFGFAEEAEFKKMVGVMARQLPDENMQKKFKEAAKEIKTIDGLSRLLNEMFTKYGDTLPYGFMVFDHAGQRSVWLQVSDKTIRAMDKIGDLCITHRRTVDDIVGQVLQLIATEGPDSEFVKGLIAETPEVDLPDSLSVLPTKEHVEQLNSL